MLMLRILEYRHENVKRVHAVTTKFWLENRWAGLWDMNNSRLN